MKSLIEIRMFAVEKAVAIMGAGTADKDVVSKAKEFESYIVGDVVVPEIYDESNAVAGVLGSILSNMPLDDKTKSKK